MVAWSSVRPPLVSFPQLGIIEPMSNSESDLTLIDGVLTFNGEPEPVPWWVEGPIVHPKHGDRRPAWRKKVAAKVNAERGKAPWVPEDRYAVTLQFRFSRHQNQKLDVDNYVKPVLDGLADGLRVDDSNFRILLIHRLRDAESREEEGVRLFVSSSGKAPPE